jgi:oxygen-independent coproporphyrinogen-3 oxidase
MIVRLEGNDFVYPIETLCVLFFPTERFQVGRDIVPEKGKNTGIVKLSSTVAFHTATTILFYKGQRFFARCRIPAEKSTTLQQLSLLCRSFYLAAQKATGLTPPWGILTGIRPVKRVAELMQREQEFSHIRARLDKEFLVAPEKAELCRKVVETQSAILPKPNRRDVSLYISVPFCPSRCSYCSFVSHSVKKMNHLLPEYLQFLHRELSVIGELIREKGLFLKTIYIGGGTPTVLDTVQLGDLLVVIEKSLSFDNLIEYTVEAGRPDTITREKIRVLKEHGVDRVSVNPQTLSDSVLNQIGRMHTVDDFFRAYEWVRASGIPCINVDFIAGLPGDTPEMFLSGIQRVLHLAPENITLHALSLKRASNFTQEEASRLPGRAEEAVQMMSGAQAALAKSVYFPYYLYKQKKTVGNLENIGFSLAGFEGYYNIYMMEELHTVLAAGAGGVTKVVDQSTNRIERLYSPKYPYEYNDRFEDVLHRKREFILRASV